MATFPSPTVLYPVSSFESVRFNVSPALIFNSPFVLETLTSLKVPDFATESSTYVQLTVFPSLSNVIVKVPLLSNSIFLVLEPKLIVIVFPANSCFGVANASGALLSLLQENKIKSDKIHINIDNAFS